MFQTYIFLLMESSVGSATDGFPRPRALFSCNESSGPVASSKTVVFISALETNYCATFVMQIASQR